MPTNLELRDDPDSRVIDIMKRLADEGIPVRAIARAVKTPSEDVYETLRDAKAMGELVEMPKDDWPSGSKRANHAMNSNVLLNMPNQFTFACQRLFKLTKTEIALFLVFLKNREVTKTQLHFASEAQHLEGGREPTEIKIVDVYICKMRRKLKEHGLSIETVWGSGYLMPAADRERAVRMLEEYTTSDGMKEAA